MNMQQFPACTLHQISDHVWWFTPEPHTDRPSLCAVVGDKSVALLDIGASPTHTLQFLDALSAQDIAAPSYAVLSHSHWDHVFGIDALGCPVIAHEESNANILRMMSLDYSDANLPNLVAEGHEVEFTCEHMKIEMTDEQRQNLVLRPADITFKNSLALHLGNITCAIQHVGGDHASDAVVIHIPEDKVLFLSDSFYHTVYQEPHHYTRNKILPLIAKLESFDAEKFILGHAGILYKQDMMQLEFDLLNEIYYLLDVHGQDQLDKIKTKLYTIYDAEDVDEYLEIVLAGINLPT